MLTQGHVSFNRVLSTQRSYLGLIRSNGLRVFVDGPEGLAIAGLPSAFRDGAAALPLDLRLRHRA